MQMEVQQPRGCRKADGHCHAQMGVVMGRKHIPPSWTLPVGHNYLTLMEDRYTLDPVERKRIEYWKAFPDRIDAPYQRSEIRNVLYDEFHAEFVIINGKNYLRFTNEHDMLMFAIRWGPE